MNVKKEYLELAEFAVEQARKAGGDAAVAAEAYVNDTESIQVTVNGRAVEQMSAVKEAGIGIRRAPRRQAGLRLDERPVPEGGPAPWSRIWSRRSFTTRPTSSTSSRGKRTAGCGPTGQATGFGLLRPAVAATPVQEKIKTALRMEAAGLDSARRSRAR